MGKMQTKRMGRGSACWEWLEVRNEILKSYERANEGSLAECEVEAGKKGPSCHVVGDAGQVGSCFGRQGQMLRTRG